MKSENLEKIHKALIDLVKQKKNEIELLGNEQNNILRENYLKDKEKTKKQQYSEYLDKAKKDKDDLQKCLEEIKNSLDRYSQGILTDGVRESEDLINKLKEIENKINKLKAGKDDIKKKLEELEKKKKIKIMKKI